MFGTERRGVDIPLRRTRTSRPTFRGVFIAGELGGMGLIRKASEQGRQAMQSRSPGVRRRRRRSTSSSSARGRPASPAGLAAIDQKLRYRLIEQERDLGGAIFHYPRNKIAMTAPVDLPARRARAVQRSQQGDAAALLAGHRRRARACRSTSRPGWSGSSRTTANYRIETTIRFAARRRGAARHRPPRHAAQARRSRRGVARRSSTGSSTPRSTRPARAGGGRRRQRRRSGARVRGAAATPW